MKKYVYMLFTAALFIALIVPSIAAASAEVKNYGNVPLAGGFESGHFTDWWDLTQSDMTLRFTYDANGLDDDLNGMAHAWAELGVRSPCPPVDFNPTMSIEGSGVWLATHYDWTANTFDPDPPGAPIQDLDDKLTLQKAGGNGEADYNLPSTPPNPWSNHAFWFDRDGVAPWQKDLWGATDNVTYGTEGIYEVVITLHATGTLTGEAYMTVNGEPQGFYVPAWHDGPADLYPAGMTFTGDMRHLRVFYGIYGYGSVHSVQFNDIIVEGTMGELPGPCGEVIIDIKPGNDNNKINKGSKGKVPVAILTTIDYDAAFVNPDTVVLAGASPANWSMNDVDEDGDMDMLLHFDTEELQLDESSTIAYLTGFTHDPMNKLPPSHQVIAINGSDTVEVSIKGKKPKK